MPSTPRTRIGGTHQRTGRAPFGIPRINPHIKIEWDAYAGLSPFVRYSVYRRATYEDESDRVRIAVITDETVTSFLDYTVASFLSYFYEVTVTASIGGVSIESAFVASLEKFLTALGPQGYWKLGEESGDAIDSSTGGNDGTVTLGSGTRDAPPLNVNGDGSFLSDGSSSQIQIPDDAAIQNMWDGGASLFFSFNAASDGEGDLGRIIDKGSWLSYLQAEVGGLLRLVLRSNWSVTDGIWYTEIDVPITTDIFGVWTYTAGVAGGQPTLLLWDGSSFSIRTVGSGLTEATGPTSGTRTTDVGTDLFISNNGAAARSFDGRLDEIAMVLTIVTQAQAEEFISLALTARQAASAHVDFDHVFVHEVDDPDNYVVFQTAESNVEHVQDRGIRRVWGRQAPTVTIGEQDFRTVRLRGLADVHRGPVWQNAQALRSLERTAGSPLMARLGFSAERLFCTADALQRQNALLTNEPELTLTETHYEEEVAVS